jgi:hypothetical protein
MRAMCVHSCIIKQIEGRTFIHIALTTFWAFVVQHSRRKRIVFGGSHFGTILS